MMIVEQIFDAYQCEGDLNDEEELTTAMVEGARAVEATILQKAVVQYCPHGLTVMLALAESHLILSTWPEYCFAMGEIFLCNPQMDTSVVFDKIKLALKPKQWRLFNVPHKVGTRVADEEPFQPACLGQRTLEEATKRRTALEVKGFRPYGASVPERIPAKELLERFDEFCCSGAAVRVAGRLTAVRAHGKVCFLQLTDVTGAIQLLADYRKLRCPTYDDFRHLVAVGDIVQGYGYTVYSNTGEPSVELIELDVLAPCAEPAIVGLSKSSKNNSQRVNLPLHCEMVVNSSRRKQIETMGLLIQCLRTTLYARGFIEVPTPVLQPAYRGGWSEPFQTFSRAHRQSAYLKVTSEFHLKRLLVGGLEKVFEIGPSFRNEAEDALHSPEFLMLEVYQAYASTTDMMELLECILYEGFHEISTRCAPHIEEILPLFSIPFERISASEALERYACISPAESNDEQRLADRLRAKGVEAHAGAGIAELIEQALMKLVRPFVENATYITDLPAGRSPLIRHRSDDQTLLDRAWLFARGLSLADIAADQTDPILQTEALLKQAEDNPFACERNDRLFLHALWFGSPPSAGIGLSVSRLFMLATGATNIRDVNLFHWE